MADREQNPQSFGEDQRQSRGACSGEGPSRLLAWADPGSRSGGRGPGVQRCWALPTGSGGSADRRGGASRADVWARPREGVGWGRGRQRAPGSCWVPADALRARGSRRARASGTVFQVPVSVRLWVSGHLRACSRRPPALCSRAGSGWGSVSDAQGPQGQCTPGLRARESEGTCGAGGAGSWGDGTGTGCYLCSCEPWGMGQTPLPSKPTERNGWVSE